MKLELKPSSVIYIVQEDAVNDVVYPMSDWQFAQIDCRMVECKYNRVGGKCANRSPAITLNSEGGFICWSKDFEGFNK